jgi:hypothetical protein
MPEWYLVILALGGFSALGTLWAPLLSALPPFALATGALLAQAISGAARARLTSAPRSRVARLKWRGLTAALYLLQPLARLGGHLATGLTPWRRRGPPGIAPPWPRSAAIWTERWQAAHERLAAAEAALRAAGNRVCRGGDYDCWDLEIRAGLLGVARLLLAVEEHDGGRQIVRFRVWPRCSPPGLGAILLGAAGSAAAALDQAWAASIPLGAVTALLAGRTLLECAAATGAILGVLKRSDP